jgi:hypothetical protein
MEQASESDTYGPLGSVTYRAVTDTQLIRRKLYAWLLQWVEAAAVADGIGGSLRMNSAGGYRGSQDPSVRDRS